MDAVGLNHMPKKILKIILIGMALSLALILIDWGMAALDGGLHLDSAALKRYALRFVLFTIFISFIWSVMIGFDHWLGKHSNEK